MTKKNGKPYFKPDTIIRNKLTGKPLLVVKMFDSGVLAVDLNIPGPQTPIMLLERDLPDWVDDLEMSLRKKKEEYKWVTI